MNYIFGDSVTITGEHPQRGLTGKVVGRGHDNDEFVLVEVSGIVKTLRRTLVERSDKPPTDQLLAFFTSKSIREAQAHHRRLSERTNPLRDQIVTHLMECGFTRRSAHERVTDFEGEWLELGRARGRAEGLMQALASLTDKTYEDILDQFDPVLEEVNS